MPYPYRNVGRNPAGDFLLVFNSSSPLPRETVPGWDYSPTRKVQELFVLPLQSSATESNYS